MIAIYKNEMVKGHINRQLVACCLEEYVDRVVDFFSELLGKNVLIETEEEVSNGC